MLRLVERHADSVACLRLLSRVIQSYELAEDRWRKISREVADMVLIRFSRGEIPIHSIEDHSVSNFPNSYTKHAIIFGQLYI